MIVTDARAWIAYPQHRHWFDKLHFSLRMNYQCGPCGVAPAATGEYVVRPIYNLDGMSAGARILQIEAQDDSKVEPGYFWCERFFGPHISVTYRWDDGWQQISAWQGFLAEGSLARFVRWERSADLLTPPAICAELTGVSHLNVEYVGGMPIEVHLRASPDPDWGNVLIPVWADEPQPEGLLESYDDASGFIPVARTGFIIR